MQRSSVELLPEDVRTELEQRLIKSGFSNYTQWADWLNAQGFEISRSAVGRYGKKFKDNLKALKTATDQAKAIVQASEDDAGAVNDAIIRLVQTKTFELLKELDFDDKNLPKIGQMVAKLATAAVRQKKWQQEMEDKIRKQAQADAADAVEKAARNQGASAETIDSLREAIMKEIAG